LGSVHDIRSDWWGWEAPLKLKDVLPWPVALMEEHFGLRKLLRAVAREVEAGELVVVKIDNPVPEAAEIQLIVRGDRTACVALQRLQRLLAGLPIFKPSGPP
jgi:hypothetical protein